MDTNSLHQYNEEISATIVPRKKENNLNGIADCW